MPVEFTLPELGENVEKGDVIRVLVKPGDVVKADQAVLELETDKATIEVPTSVAGTVSEVKVKPGEKISVGQVVLVIDGAKSAAQTDEGSKAQGVESTEGSQAQSGEGSKAPSGEGSKAQRPKGSEATSSDDGNDEEHGKPKTPPYPGAPSRCRKSVLRHRPSPPRSWTSPLRARHRRQAAWTSARRIARQPVRAAKARLRPSPARRRPARRLRPRHRCGATRASSA